MTLIRREYRELDNVWFEQALGFLKRTMPNHTNPGFDDRNSLFEEFYTLKKNVLHVYIEEIRSFLKQRIQEEYFIDVWSFYSVLGYFNYHDEISELSEYFMQVVKDNKSNENAIRQNKIYRNISSIEKAVSDGEITKMVIESTKL